jgi:hypothetical protein
MPIIEMIGMCGIGGNNLFCNRLYAFIESAPVSHWMAKKRLCAAAISHCARGKAGFL